MRYNYVKYNLSDGAHKYFDRRILLTAIGTLAVAILFTFGLFTGPTNRETTPPNGGPSQSAGNNTNNSGDNNGSKNSGNNLESSSNALNNVSFSN